MNEDIFQGYKGEALKTLKKFNVRVWGLAEFETTRGMFKGTVLPRAENDDDKHIVIKIETGYNIGISTNTITSIKEIDYYKANYKIPEKEFPYNEKIYKDKLIGTGGTIASRLDYRTGAVIPAFSPGELYGAVPELADICNLNTEKVFAVFSENMGPEQYKALAIAIGKEIENGVDGIVIGHGTDTLHHTAAALSFMVQNSPVPIVLVGSQRSSDRPSSDAALNLMHACYAAGHGDIAEVVICMFGPTSDEYGFLHRGTRVRKMHSSYRSPEQTFLPHESFIMAPGERVEIDFPDATIGSPTSCLTIEIAKEKAKKAGLPVEFVSRDIAGIDLQSSFDAVIGMFAVMSYQASNLAFARACRTANKYLKHGGTFIFDCWYGPAVLTEKPTMRIKEVKLNDNERIIRLTEPVLNTLTHTVEVCFTLMKIRNNCLINETKESHLMRFLFPQEVKYFLEVAGFSEMKLCPFLQLEESLGERDWNMAVIARK